MSEEYSDALPSGFHLGSYEIQSVLGVGGFGVTYRAYDHVLKQTVAIKEYLPSGIATRHHPDFFVKERSEANKEFYQYGLNRFLEEARTLAKFRNPNIVRVIRYVKSNGTAYLVMDFEKGVSLSERLKKSPLPDEKEIYELLIPLLAGLHSVHEQGFLHRDIKPGNILIREDGSIVLIDFGSARQALSQKNTVLTTIMTPGYAPFEQYFHDDQQGPWTDLYSLGATIFHCITGEKPVIATKRQDVIQHEMTDPVMNRLSTIQEGYSSGLISLIAWTMEPDPRNRPQTVDIVLQHINGSIKNIEIEKKLATTLNTIILERNNSSTDSSISMDYLNDARINLINQVGPIADLLIKKALQNSSNIEEFNQKIFDHLSSEKQKSSFIEMSEVLRKSGKHSQSIVENSPDGEKNQWDDDIINAARKNLVMFVGPIATILIKKAIRKTSSHDQLVDYLAKNIDDEKHRDEFIRRMKI